VANHKSQNHDPGACLGLTRHQPGRGKWKGGWGVQKTKLGALQKKKVSMSTSPRHPPFPIKLTDKLHGKNFSVRKGKGVTKFLFDSVVMPIKAARRKKRTIKADLKVQPGVSSC